MNKYNGFSLIEMAIALAVIGFLIGGLLKPMSSVMDYQKIKYTDATLEQIKEALVGFAIINNRLPCPAKCSKFNGKDIDCFNGVYDATDVGKETTDSTFCKQKGYLPWADLGIGRYDGWDEQFYYRVDKNYSTILSTNELLKTDSSKKLTIKYKQTNKNLTLVETINGENYSRVIAIILSSGKNGDLETVNKGSDATYVQGDYNIDENDYFDDRLTWLSKYSLINYLAKTRDIPQ